LKDEDHVAKVIEEPDGDVNPETEKKVATAKDAKRTRGLKGWRNQLNLREKQTFRELIKFRLFFFC
jgi:hypothetical protein